MSGRPQRSERIDALLAELVDGTGRLNRIALSSARASEHPCEGAKFHSPAPITTTPIATGPGEEVVWLCPTCLSKLEIYLALNEFAPEKMDWPVRQEFGNQIRLLGQRLTATKSGEAS